MVEIQQLPTLMRLLLAQYRQACGSPPRITDALKGRGYVQMNRKLKMNALRIARLRRKPKPGLLRHSDHGSQHCSGDYRTLQAGYGMGMRMRRKGSCRSNAPMRSCFNSLKNERVLHGDYVRKEEARQDLFDYIEVFYSRRRRHPALHYKNLAQHHAAWRPK